MLSLERVRNVLYCERCDLFPGFQDGREHCPVCETRLIDREHVPVIILALDSDEAGQKATLRALEKYANVQWEEPDGNPRWIENPETYLEWKLVADDFILDYPKTPLRAWPRARLIGHLRMWHEIMEGAIHWENPSSLEFYLPMALDNQRKILDEVTRRYTPKKAAYNGEPTLRGRLDADRVMRGVNLEYIYTYFLGPLIPKKISGKPVWMGHCPFHADQTPSFKINQEDGLWYCFPCGIGGSVFNFVMKVENIPFPEALGRVADIGGYVGN